MKPDGADAPRRILETRETERQRAGWLLYEVPEAWVEEARRWRASRDVEFNDNDVYARAETDERWVGELGEMVFDWWLRSEGVTDFRWIREEPAGKPDFRIRSARVSVKTVKRRGGFYRGYCGQVSAKHVHEPVDAYFFLSYQWCRRNRVREWEECRRIWLVGGCSREKYRRHAHRTDGPAVDPCNPEYRVRIGHSIYNADERHFAPPREWLRHVLDRFPPEP